jgi:hypothetical protein
MVFREIHPPYDPLMRRNTILDFLKISKIKSHDIKRNPKTIQLHSALGRRNP